MQCVISSYTYFLPPKKIKNNKDEECQPCKRALKETHKVSMYTVVLLGNEHDSWHIRNTQKH